jgi:hypothetical protein
MPFWDPLRGEVIVQQLLATVDPNAKQISTFRQFKSAAQNWRKHSAFGF